MKKLIKIFKAFLLASFILTSCHVGNNSNSVKVSNSPKLNEIKLNTLKRGTVMIFGTGCDDGCDSIYLEFVSDNKAKLSFTSVWEPIRNSGHFRKEFYTGEYDVKFLPQNAIVSDNEYWPIFDSLIILSNTNYGFDKGYVYLVKGYAIAKCKSKSNGTIQGPRLYKWLDPINYPDANNEYSFSTSKLLEELKINENLMTRDSAKI